MIAFAIVAVVMVAVALICVLPALLRKQDSTQQHVERDQINLSVLRDQLQELDADLDRGTLDAASFESSQREIEHRLIEELQPAVTPVAGKQRWAAVVVGLAVPVLAVSLYFLLGNVNALDPAKVALAEQGREVSEAQIQAMVVGLAEKLKTQPDNIEGWNMLARSYNALGKFTEATQAYAHLVKLVPTNADYLVSYADTLAVTLNKNLQGEPEKLLKHALELDPQNVRGLALIGSAAFDRQDYNGAIAYWKKLLILVPPDSEMARSIMSSIGEAQALMSGTTPSAPAALSEAAPVATPAAPVAAIGAQVSGMVTLSPQLKAAVADTDVVFIYAKAAQGPQFPLAVLRKQVKDLPVSFVLDDSMGVVPNVKLSDYPQLKVGARISKSGNATPAAGDLEGVIEAVALGSNNLKIVINTQRK